MREGGEMGLRTAFLLKEVQKNQSVFAGENAGSGEGSVNWGPVRVAASYQFPEPLEATLCLPEGPQHPSKLLSTPGTTRPAGCGPTWKTAEERLLAVSSTLTGRSSEPGNEQG